MKGHVELEDFQGPLEMLLTLVQNEELSLTRIHLIEVLDQILEGLKDSTNIQDLNDSGDLLIIVTTLMELKSKLLLPGEVDIAGEIDALKEDLLEKILVHRRLFGVLDAMERRFYRRSARHGRPNRLGRKIEKMIPLEGQDPAILVDVINYIREQVRRDSFRVDYTVHPVEHFMNYMRRELGKTDFSLTQLVQSFPDRIDFTGILIALLEMVRQWELGMDYDPENKDVRFFWRTEEERAQEQKEREEAEIALRKEEAEREKERDKMKAEKKAAREAKKLARRGDSSGDDDEDEEDSDEDDEYNDEDEDDSDEDDEYDDEDEEDSDEDDEYDEYDEDSDEDDDLTEDDEKEKE